MSLVLHNTLTGAKEPFRSLNPKQACLPVRQVRMYSCGPTVYSHPHIGNFRSFIASDVLRRYLEYLDYKVVQIMNITDVGHLTTDDQISGGAGEDKIQAAALRENKSPTEIARFYETEFLELAKLLNLRPATKYPRATEHIPEMIDLIQKLISGGYAYVVNGNVYFEVAQFPDYGKLSGNTMENLLAGARIEVNPEKRSPLDFALWKQDPKHLMQWDSPWGRGFPGWHIECSAMSLKYLGAGQIDIHTGGEDNIFPHHESEIAQSEAATGQPFVRYWFHTRHLLVDNQKMSKSLGNFYTVRDIMSKGYHPLVLRYALLNTHYRQQLNFTMESLNGARSALERLRDFKQRLEESRQKAIANSQKGLPKLLQETQEGFEEAMNDDLNISEALAVIFEMVREVNKMDLSRDEAELTLGALERVDSVLGVLSTGEGNLEAEVEKLIEERQQARRAKDYAKSDALRAQLDKMGIILEDTPQGIRWKRKI